MRPSELVDAPQPMLAPSSPRALHGQLRRYAIANPTPTPTAHQLGRHDTRGMGSPARGQKEFR
eukprot:m.35537 g.35537  ORF g.35537 m.35537 type:complete len:63 (-) comp12779_c1_seq2:291-479(-)